MFRVLMPTSTVKASRLNTSLYNGIPLYQNPDNKRIAIPVNSQVKLPELLLLPVQEGQLNSWLELAAKVVHSAGTLLPRTRNI